jgi:lipopolysaccharide transport system ATP-binding protein
MIAAQALSKRYVLGRGGPRFAAPRLLARRRRSARSGEREIWALRDVSFDVDAGTVLGIIGANGAGKTTLLKLLGRVTIPTSGRAVVRGRVASLLELGAGFHPDATGRQSVYMNAAMLGIPTGVVDRKLSDIVDFAGIGEFIDVPVKRYSSGMYLRLAFSVAINLDPDVMLADEVLAVGDLAFQEQCLQRVEEGSRAGLTVLFVSHDMQAIKRLCDRVIWLHQGQIVREGNSAEVVEAYEESVWALLRAGDRGRAASEHGAIVATRLLSSDGDEIGAARVGDELCVEVLARIEHGGSRARCALAFFVGDTVAFRTALPYEIDVSAAGTYAFHVRVPPHLLADTAYRVKAGIQLAHVGDQTDLVDEHALTFRVYDTDEAQSARGNYPRALDGVVRPKLEWSVERVESVGLDVARPTGRATRA